MRGFFWILVFFGCDGGFDDICCDGVVVWWWAVVLWRFVIMDQIVVVVGSIGLVCCYCCGVMRGGLAKGGVDVY